MTRGSIISTIYAVFIGVVMNVFMTAMLTTTYSIPTDVWQIGFVTVFEAILFAILLRYKSEKWALLSLGVILVYVGVCLATNHYYSRECFNRVVYKFRDIVVQDVAHGRGKTEVTNNMNMAVLFMFINVIPTYFVIRVIQLQRPSWQAIIWTIPYWLLTLIARQDTTPSAIVVVNVVVVLFLILYGSLRKAPRKELDITAGIVLGFVVVFSFGLWALFPSSKYNSDKPSKRLEMIVNYSDTHFNTHLAQFKFDRIFRKGARPDSVVNSFKELVIDNGASFSTDITDLRGVGNFSPKDIPIMDVFLSVAYSSYFDWYSASDRVFYLKASSMSSFKNDQWERAESPVPVYSEAEGDTLEDIIVYGGLYVSPKHKSNFYYVPNYAAPKLIDAESKVVYGSKNGFQATASYNYSDSLFAYESVDKDSKSASYSYYLYNYDDSNASIPDWTDDYLYYVRNDCLFVPVSVENEIINSGVLPDWYMDVYKGTTSMTKEEKVKNVMDFVYNLHSYDQDTPYAPENEEFIVWFMTESDTGFCVHFATTAAILLRMIDVPTRYVVGYLVGSLNPGENTTIYDRDAHAWCEYFDSELGWVEFDPTLNRMVDGNHYFNDITDDTVVAETETVTETINETVTVTVTPIPTSAPASDANQENTIKHFELPEERINPVAEKTRQEAVTVGYKELDRESLDEIENRELRLITLWRSVVKTIAYIILAFLLIFVVLRIIYTTITLKHMNKGSLNDRARAYYRYVRRIVGLYGRNPEQRIEDLTDIAMYSLEGINDDMFNEMKKLVTESVNEAMEKNSLSRKFFVQLALLV